MVAKQIAGRSLIGSKALAVSSQNLAISFSEISPRFPHVFPKAAEHIFGRAAEGVPFLNYERASNEYERRKDQGTKPLANCRNTRRDTHAGDVHSIDCYEGRAPRDQHKAGGCSNHNVKFSPKSTSVAKVTLPSYVPYREIFIAAGRKHKVSPYLLAAQAKQESANFNTDVIECRRNSQVGAQGIAQWMPKTAAAWHVEPCDVGSAIDGMARYDAATLKKFKSEPLALAAYNAGIGEISTHRRIRFNETRTYVARIEQFKKEMQNG